MINGTALENLTLPARLQGKTLEDPNTYMEYVGLTEDLLTRGQRAVWRSAAATISCQNTCK